MRASRVAAFGRRRTSTSIRLSSRYVKNYELGLKSTWLDGRLTFNPTVFLSDYEEKQESILIPVSLSNVATVVRNASTEEIFGVELEMNFQITQNWSLRANYGYIDAEYDNYIADITGDGVITDNSNLIPRNTPENTFGVITTYDADFGPGTLQTTVSYRYRDTVEIEASNAPFGHMDSINDLSGSISYLWSDNRYRITLYGKNLTDDQELAQGTIAPLTTRGWWTTAPHHRRGICDLILGSSKHRKGGASPLF